jgi:hypothetical protein
MNTTIPVYKLCVFCVVTVAVVPSPTIERFGFGRGELSVMGVLRVTEGLPSEFTAYVLLLKSNGIGDCPDDE